MSLIKAATRTVPIGFDQKDKMAFSMVKCKGCIPDLVWLKFCETETRNKLIKSK